MCQLTGDIRRNEETNEWTNKGSSTQANVKKQTKRTRDEVTTQHTAQKISAHKRTCESGTQLDEAMNMKINSKQHSKRADATQTKEHKHSHTFHI